MNESLRLDIIYIAKLAGVYRVCDILKAQPDDVSHSCKSMVSFSEIESQISTDPPQHESHAATQSVAHFACCHRLPVEAEPMIAS